MTTNGARRRVRKIARKHEWLDENYNFVFSHVKYDDGSWGYWHPALGGKCGEHPDAKIFPRGCPRKPDRAAGLLWRMGELLESLADGMSVGWFAGEKDAETGYQAALCDAATSVHQGEKAEVTPEQFAIFSGCRSRIDLYLDDDPTGRANGAARYDGLRAVDVPAKRLRLLLPPEGFNDVSDALADADGRTRGFRELSIIELRKLVREDIAAAAARKKREGGTDLLAAFHELLRAAGCRPASSGQDWTCPNPEHNDKNPSFGVIAGENGGLVLNCQKCMPRSGTPEHTEWLEEILLALGTDSSAISAPRRKRKGSGSGGGKGERETVSSALIRIALDGYRLGKSDDARPFAVAHGGNVVRFFDRGIGEFADELANAYFEEAGKAAGSSAIAEAMGVLRGKAQQKAPEVVVLRVGLLGGIDKQIAIDLGDNQDRILVVGPGGWEIRNSTPLLFRRTKATMPFPEPVRGLGIEALRDLLNLSDVDFDLVVSWMVAAFMPDIQHPILMLTGAQGTGKSDATRMISLLVDPSSVPLRKRPRDEQEWSVAAHASWAVSLENMSWIPDWLSDDLCRSVTGDGVIERQLHTNDDIRIRSFRRVVLINGIDPGGVRGDLADRMVSVRLQKIKKRLSESDIEEKFSGLAGGLFGALLDLLVEVLKVQLSGKHIVEYQDRMGDFAMVARAVDIVRETDSFSRFTRLKEQGIADITEDDPMTGVMLGFLSERKGTWAGTPTDLYGALDAYLEGKVVRRPEGWPKTPRALGQAFTRLEPGWADMGLVLQRARGAVRKWRISYTKSNRIQDP